MSFGIKMSDCKFYVDEEARTIVCVIPNTRYMLSNFIEQHFQYGDINFDFATTTRFIQNELLMPRSFMGKAVCSKDDEWDEELGKLVAFSRAKDKCYKSFFRRANTFVNSVDRRLGDIIDMFNSMGQKLEDKREGIEQKIEEMTQK